MTIKKIKTHLMATLPFAMAMMFIGFLVMFFANENEKGIKHRAEAKKNKHVFVHEKVIND